MTGSVNHKIFSLYTSKSRQLFFLLSIILAFVFLITRILIIFSYNGEIGGIDNNFVYAVTRGIAGYNIYPDPAKFPYAVNPYSPLYYTLCITTGKLFHINTENAITVYWLCRSVSLLCDLVTLFLVYTILYKRFKTGKQLAFSLTILLSGLLAYIGYTFSRVDSLYLVFYTSAIALLLKEKFDTKTVLLLLPLFSVLAIFSKQSGIIIPVLVLVKMLITKEFRFLFIYLLSFALFFSGISLLYLYGAGYTYIFSHSIKAINNRIDPSWFYVYIFKRFSDSLIILLLYIPLVWSFKRFFQNPSVLKKSLGSIFIIQLVFSAGTSLKWGSTPSYFNESFILGIIIAGIIIREKDPDVVKKLISWILPLYLLFTVHIYAQDYLFFIQNRQQKKTIYLNQKAIKDYLQPSLKDNYMLDLGQENRNFYKVLFYKEAAVPNFDGVDCCTLPDNTFDYSDLRSAMENGKIKYLVIPQADRIDSIWGVSLASYKKDTVLYGEAIYRFEK